jgi:NAD(P)-dependent dehydrogenase (short-subunit alcohol dehydrogenase family)
MAELGWITGAGSGLGRETALRLARQGWRLAVSGRDRGRLEALAAEAPAGTIHPYPVDVTDPEAMEATAAAIAEEMGPLDLALFNAGDYQPMTLDEFDPALFRRIMEVNYMGVVHGIQAVLGRMAAGGQVVLTASVAGYRGLPRAAPYGASKAAVISMAESLEPEFRARGLRLRVVNPGFIRTPLTAKNTFHMPALMEPEEAARALVAGLMGRGFEIHFPKRFTRVMKILRCLPIRLYLALTGRMIGG